MYFIVVNLGLRSVRAILFDDKANKLGHVWYPIESIVGSHRVEQNPDEWWKLSLITLKELSEKVPQIRGEKVILSVTSSACCLVPLGRQGIVLHRSLMVSDKRAQKEADELKERYEKYFQSNNAFLPVASYMFPKILWMQRNRPEIHKKVWKYLSPNDFLIYKLTGECITDELNAHKFYYSQSDTSFFDELTNAYKLKKSMFPKVKSPGYKVGPIIKEIAEEIGISPRSTVILTTYDAICAFWGAGVSKVGDSCNVIGTVSSCRVLTDKPINFKSNLLTQKFSLFEKFIVGGSNNIDGGLIEWAKDSFYGDSYPVKYVYNIMEDEAKKSVLGSRGLLFLPYILGERAPFWDPEVRGMFLGIERFHRRPDFIRSIYESSGFMLRDMCESMRKHGVKIKNIRLSGGLSQSDLVCRIRADIMGVDVHVMSERESTALGSFLISMYSMGKIKKLDNVKDFVTIEKTYSPNEEAHRNYSKLFKLFKRVYKKSADINRIRRRVYRDLLDPAEVYTLENM